jgi:hypothetical protein
MKLREVRAVAKQRRVHPGRMKKAEHIKALQRDEGNNDCTAWLWWKHNRTDHNEFIIAHHTKRVLLSH